MARLYKGRWIYWGLYLRRVAFQLDEKYGSWSHVVRSQEAGVNAALSLSLSSSVV